MLCQINLLPHGCAASVTPVAEGRRTPWHEQDPTAQWACCQCEVPGIPAKPCSSMLPITVPSRHTLRPTQDAPGPHWTLVQRSC